MKVYELSLTLTTILTLVLFGSLSAFSQTYHPFPTDSAIWSVEEVAYSYGDPPDLFNDCITKHYGLAGDTVIDHKVYSKLYGNNLPSDYPFEDTAFNLQTADYVAAVREDFTKKVWIREPNDTSDILYYDFSLGKGDTFCFPVF